MVVTFAPIFFARYVDDIFVLLRSNAHIEKLTGYMSSKHPNIRFTYEEERENALPFLDVNVYRDAQKFSSTVHRKTTFSGVYSNFNSFLPLSYKRGLVSTLLYRAFSITSSYYSLHLELEKLKIIFSKNGFHFTSYEKQVCVIEQALQERPIRKRGGRSLSFQQNRAEPNGEKREKQTNNLLQTGDFYITKHSNLAEVHAVFHLVTDDTVTSSNINSRHAILIGIRNIMLAAARHNITNMVIPLLLVHEMGENLTVQWCMKRAELVLKCVKGFMMESLSWDGHESRTLQFVVPPGISEDMFIAFSNMLPNIFRVSNPLDLSNLSVK